MLPQGGENTGPLSATAFAEGVFGAPFICYNARQSDLLTGLQFKSGSGA